MRTHFIKYIAIFIFTLLFSTFAVQSVDANGVKVSTQYSNGKYKITLTSQEKGKGIKIVAFSPANGKTINVTYAFDKKASTSANINIEESMVLAPFRVITTNTNDLKYRPYTDILNTENDEYIRHLHDAGITAIFSDTKFKPESTITRAEAAALIATAIKLKVDSTSKSKFSDVNNHWAKKYINAVVKKGIMGGVTDKTFKPNNNISVAEVCTIISKSFKFKTKSQGIFTKLKKDKWYTPYVYNIFNLKILTPQDSIYNSFNENGYISRGNFAKMLSRALSTY